MQVNGIVRLTKDPEIRKTQTGETVVNFDVAWNYGENGHFIRCTAWGKLAELIGEFTKKGHAIYIIGKLVQSSFTTTRGENRKTHEIKVSQIEFIEKKPTPVEEKQVEKPRAVADETDDDLPF